RHQRGAATPLARVEDYLGSEALAAGGAKRLSPAIVAFDGTAQVRQQSHRSVQVELSLQQFEHFIRQHRQVQVRLFSEQARVLSGQLQRSRLIPQSELNLGGAVPFLV